MRRLVLGMAAAAACLGLPGTAFAQGISIGPGGVQIDDGRRPYGVQREYYEERRGPSRAMCRELRQACLYKEELGEQGAGNCRRYRRMCG